jgi:transposase
VAELAQTVKEVTGGTVDVAFVDQGYTGELAQSYAQDFGRDLVVVKHTEAKRGSCPAASALGSVERGSAWAACFRRLRRDYERLATRSQDSISSRSPASCSVRPLPCSDKIHNTF